MQKCETCGNDYDKAFKVIVDGKNHVFDSFECAIRALAPICPHCGCRIIGHGVEKAGQIFCCVHCASGDGPTELKDRSGSAIYIPSFTPHGFPNNSEKPVDVTLIFNPAQGGGQN